MSDIADFISKFTIAVDFQDQIDIKGDTVLADLPEWDSLAALGVIIMFDSDYGLTVTGDDLKKCATVGDLHALIQAKAK